jgi:hypothetical protein
MANVLATITLASPIPFGKDTIDTLSVMRETMYGDFIEMERRGWMDGGAIKSECQLQAHAFLVWQLTGLAPTNVEKLSRVDMNAAVEMILPFAFEVTSKPSGAQDLIA